MQKDLLDQLVGKDQREVSGSLTAARFDYQKQWAFCEMLKRHMQKADYLVAFEFHDDVVFLQPSENPTAADFCQVKTASSIKKLSTLTAKRSGSSSVLGKMFLNFQGICEDFSVRVILVSNVPFEFSDCAVCAADIDPKYRQRIIEKLKEEIASFSEGQLDHLHFMVAGVSIDSMPSYLTGEAMELFRWRFGENHGLNVHSWIRLVQGEIARKNNLPSDAITTSDELVQNKCISRSFIDKSLDCVLGERRATPDMSLVYAELVDHGWSRVDLMTLDKRLPQAMADYTDTANGEIADLVSSINETLSSKSWVLGELIDHVHANYDPSKGLNPYADKPYLAALTILVFYEAL